MFGRKSPCSGGSRRYGKSERICFILFLAVFLFAAAMGLGCSKKKEVKAEKIINVKVWTTQKQAVRPYIEAVGSLKPNEEVIISPEVDGILKDIRVDEGTQVTKGTVLAVISDTDYRLNAESARAAVKQAEASLANTRIEYRRKETLLKEELVTRQQFDDVSTRLTLASRDLDRAKAVLSLSGERLGKTVVRSPITGIVKEKIASEGDFARAGIPIMRIVQIDPLKLSFSIAEKDMAAMKEGQDVVFTVDPFPGKEFTGRLSVIYPGLDERSRTLQVEALVSNPSLALKSGLFTRVKVYTAAPRDSVVIPITSILYEGTRVKVFLMDANTARERIIGIGKKYGEMMEVTQGLKAGEQLIVVGQNNLLEGVKVHAVK